MTSATRRPAPRTILATAATLSVLALTGACGVGSDSASNDAGDDSGGSVAADAPAAAGDEGGQTARDGNQAAGDAADLADESAVTSTSADAPPAPDAPADQDQKLISNGAVQLKSEDVGQAIFDVRKVVDTYNGEVEGNETQTDDEGEPLRARLQLRVPTAQFGAAMQDLERVAVLIASSGNTKDVTTEVLDKDIRVQVQRRSIERISLLLEQATSIRDVVAIEAQLSQRQADLAVLEKEQRYLADQTAMATISVSVERIKEEKKEPPTEKKDDDSGFFAGLAGGWDALTTFGVGLATVLGALLPWMVVAAVLAVPTVPLLRRFRRKDATPTPAA